jgi:PqqD family protein of HPr-rel-A system
MMATAGSAVEFPKAEALQRLALSDSGFVFDPMTGNSFTVNATGLAILRHLQKGAGRDELLQTLQEEFEVDPVVAERDVIEFADLLRNQFK